MKVMQLTKLEIKTRIIRK